MKKVLIKNLIIPAGTIFNEAPKKIELSGEGHFSTIIGMSNDSYGELLYHFDIPNNEDLTEDEQKRYDKDSAKIKEWFADVEEKSE